MANSRKTNGNEINGKETRNVMNSGLSLKSIANITGLRLQTRSQVNVIQSTTSSAEHKNLLNRGQQLLSSSSVDDSVISVSSGLNGSDGQRLEYVEFVPINGINVLANTSAQLV